MSLYLSGSNDSRNNRGSRYQETFFLVLSVFFSPSSSTRKSEASSRPTRVTTYFFYRGTHSGRYRGYCLLSRDLYAFAIFPSRDWTRQGWLEKSRCVAWLDDTHWKTSARGSVIRSANDICRNVPRGANFIPLATWPVIADITFPAYFSL